ncbi:hypothetical protein FQ775_02775 [Nitratireductor mangrovi]|uniref:Uncharacterized protein n=1 Tax=Nitratireductor mangrovi TaxID=2599600 RepID=A0A5B8KUT8_9HYPH|nr:hypothetical protein [Nitratireductor mangrovi]QDY99383.1 hypothetical protein FQ775_02775 [Nitratireductor mangrovi]
MTAVHAASVGPEAIKAIIAGEIAGYDAATEARRASRTGSDATACWYSRTLEDFEAALIEPAPVMVGFSGGFEQRCWSVTRGDGRYRVVYMPMAGYFSLAVDTVFGPVDIGVHGRAIEVFGAV